MVENIRDLFIDQINHEKSIITQDGYDMCVKLWGGNTPEYYNGEEEKVGDKKLYAALYQKIKSEYCVTLISLKEEHFYLFDICPLYANYKPNKIPTIILKNGIWK